ncbi:hypothetical protein C5E46_05735 [Nocardia nova]|nr:hypothetical protein C5E46_05735 [Nocardia nova]
MVRANLFVVPAPGASVPGAGGFRTEQRGVCAMWVLFLLTVGLLVLTVALVRLPLRGEVRRRDRRS